jgi:hypothetical protein
MQVKNHGDQMAQSSELNRRPHYWRFEGFDLWLSSVRHSKAAGGKVFPLTCSHEKTTQIEQWLYNRKHPERLQERM